MKDPANNKPRGKENMKENIPKQDRKMSHDANVGGRSVSGRMTHFAWFTHGRALTVLVGMAVGMVFALGLGGSAFATNYSVVYHSNLVGNMPVDVSSKTMASSISLSDQAPTRDGFQFKGWCTTLTVDGGTCSGTQYSAGGDYTINQTGNNNLTLYAMWEKEDNSMQNFTLTKCSNKAASGNYTVVDERDDNEYTVKYINGQCWMTQNLRFTGTSLTTDTSNVTSAKTLTYYSLKNSASSSSTKCYGTTSSGNGYSNACMEDSGNATTGVWYNYYAASAGTVSNIFNFTAATEDICPKGWHLPSGPNTTANTDFNKLVGNTTSGWQNPTAGLTAFGAVAGGRYSNGSLGNTGVGGWWSATASDAADRYNLYYDSGQFYGNDRSSRYYGYFVRCVRSS